MNTTENNKIIAEFMGVDYNTQIAIICSDLYEQGYRSTEIINNLEPLIPYSFYHSDWNWLMEVVDKIYETDLYYDKYIDFNRSMFSDGEIKLSTRIDLVYNQCIEFINWYNQNK